MYEVFIIFYIFKNVFCTLKTSDLYFWILLHLWCEVEIIFFLRHEVLLELHEMYESWYKNICNNILRTGNTTVNLGCTHITGLN